MSIELVSAAFVSQDLSRKIMTATSDVENEWFFFDGSFNFATSIETSVNTWLHENFVALYNNEIIAYFEAAWSRPLDIITGFRVINFSKKYSRAGVEAFFMYLDYLFTNRGCIVLNWLVALQNKKAKKQYDQFVNFYCGHIAGLRHHAQKSYTGKISDVCLYEITCEEFFDWKRRGFKKRI
jgi:hypothetical protein